MCAFAAQSILTTLDRKERALRARLTSLPRLVVAYSGDCGSAYLACAAHQTLGDAMIAVLVDFSSVPRRELKLAIEFAERRQIPLKVVSPVRENGESIEDLFAVIEQQRVALGFARVAYGTTVDRQHRLSPAQQYSAVVPLVEAGFNDRDVRDLTQREDLARPDGEATISQSPQEYGQPVTREALLTIEAGELALRDLGFRHARVRHHGEIVRIEISRDEVSHAFSPQMAELLVPKFKKLGFKYVTLDCESYRSGSINSVLPMEQMKMVG